MGKGRTYELDTVRGVKDATDERFVYASVPDYSGAASGSFCDLVVIAPHGYEQLYAAFIELKKRSGDEGKRTIVMDGGTDDESGREELERLIDGTPNWGRAYVAIKFDHRELIVLQGEYLLRVLTEGAESHDDVSPRYSYAEEYAHAARLTDAGSISMIKPALSYWESSSAGQSDVRKLLEQTGFPEQYFDE